MNIVSCRKCGTSRQITDESREHKYPNGIVCVDCWSKPHASKGISVGKNSKVVTGNSRSTSSSTPHAVDSQNGWEISCKYEVGDSVFINTDKYGVLLCQIIDSEAWGMEHIFYTLDAKGHTLDYVEEEEVFDTAEEAQNTTEILKVT